MARSFLNDNDDCVNAVHDLDVATALRPSYVSVSTVDDDDESAKPRRRFVRPPLRDTQREDDAYDSDDGDGGCELENEDADDNEHESIGVMIAMALLVLGLLAFVGYIGYHVVVAEGEFAKRLPMRRQAEVKHVQVDVDLAQLYSGHRVQIELDRRVVCEHCAGTGSDLHAGFHTCHKCDGTGVQTSVQQIGPIKQRVRSVCPVCDGRGQVPKTKCSVCHGRGLREEHQQLVVEVEKGMRQGDQLVLARQGDQSPKTLPGDLVVHLNVKPHPVFARRGDDLEFQLEITLLEALVGFTREVVHLDGHVVHLEREHVVSPESVWCIPREGMPIRDGAGGRAGDLLVRFAIAFPPANETLDTGTKAAIVNILTD